MGKGAQRTWLGKELQAENWEVTQNHLKLLKLSVLEMTLQMILFQPPAMVRDTFLGCPWNALCARLVEQVLEPSPRQDWDFHEKKPMSCISRAGRLHAWKYFQSCSLFIFQNWVLRFSPEQGGFPWIVGITHWVFKGSVVSFS